MSEKETQASADAQSVESEINGAEAAQEDSMLALQRDLEAMEGKAKEHWDQLLRTQAELENLRRRAERDLENAHKFALERFAKELLPVKDSLELGLEAAGGADAEKIREGMEMTLRLLTQVLEKHGIREVNPVGERFNPELHEAVSTQPSEDQPPNTVVAVMQKGYTLNDRLLRPAMVVVSKASE